MKAVPAPALGGGSLMSLQNGLKVSRGGIFSKVQYFFIFPSKHIFACMKYLNKENGIFKYRRSSHTRPGLVAYKGNPGWNDGVTSESVLRNKVYENLFLLPGTGS